MALDDLDLEFEDEEDLKNKKCDAVHVDVDLVFQSQESQPPQNRPSGPSQGGQGNVHSLPERRPPPRPQAAATSGGMRGVGQATALKITPNEGTKSQKDLMEHVRKVEFEAEVKVRVADFKAEILGEILGDMKFMEHQIGQLLVRLNTKHPESKQEILMIKKILADFTAKKRK